MCTFLPLAGTRLLSITTRIKTLDERTLFEQIEGVLDYCPLQQGLRPLRQDTGNVNNTLY